MLNQNTFVNFNRAVQSVNLVKNSKQISEEMEDGKMKKKTVRIGDCRTQEESDKLTEEEITETTFHRTCRIRRGTLEDSCAARSVMWDQDAVETKNLLSIWDLVSKDQEMSGNIKELEAVTQMVTSSPRAGTHSVSPTKSIIEVDLTAEDDNQSQEVSEIQPSKRINKRQTQLESSLADMGDVGSFSLSKLFDKTLLAELISEDVRMDRLRRVIERKDRAGFELMGPYTTPLWNQLSVIDDCILVDNRLAVPIQLRQAVMKRIHRGHPGQEAMIDVSNYLWWPHMHKDIVNLAEECRECTRYGKNAKWILPKNSSQPLPLLSQPGQEVQLDYAGPLEDYKGKKIYLLTAIDRFSKFPSVKVTKSTGGKSTIKFLRSYIDTHRIPESIKTDQFSGFKGKAMKKFCLENNIEQKFCPVGDHRGCGLVERTIQTIKRRLGVMLLEENVKSIKLCLSTIIRDMRWIKQKTIQKSPFEAHFGRLPKTEFKIIRDKFVEFSDHLDKQHLERSALTANQLKKRIDQSRDSLKIVKKGQKSKDVSPLFKQASMSTQERNRARNLRNLLEANANWNAERRRYDGPSLTQLVDTTSTIDPELRKELLYSWEKGFVEDKPKGSEWNSHNLSRRDETRKSGAALTKPFKGKVAFDSSKTVTTAAGAVYRKSDLVKLPSSPTKIPKEGTNQKEKAKSPSEEPKSKHQKKDDELFEDTISEEEEWNIPREQAKDLFQDSETGCRNIAGHTVGGGLNLAIK